jgi:hypothetical protein
MTMTARRVFDTGVFASALLLCAAATVHAQLSIPACGGFSTFNEIWQTGSGSLTVEALASTTRQVNAACPAQVRVELWVEGTRGGAGSATNTYAASDSITRYVSSYGLANSRARHWWIWLITGGWDFLGETHAQVNVAPPGPSAPPPPEEPICGVQVSWSDSACDCGEHPDYSFCGSPILIDTANDGYHLTDVEHGVLFDLDCTGIPKRTAWTRAGSDDAFLVMDRNGNGIIDSGCELFGNHTPAFTSDILPNAANGFEALGFLHDPGYGRSLLDTRVDRRDAPFRRLLLWRDLNHNGISEPEELEPVTDTALLAISTEYKRTPRKDRYGNAFLLKGKSWWRRPDGGVEARPVFDVWFRTEENAPGPSRE